MSARLGLLAVPAARQQAAVQRTLRSFEAHLAEMGRSFPAIVFHSPRTASEQDEMRAAIEAVSRSARYVGMREKLALAKQLRKITGVAPELLEFALFQNEHRAAYTVGADRNAALLWSAGKRMLCTDDDASADLFALADRSSDAALASGPAGDPRESGECIGPLSVEGGIAGAMEAAWDEAFAAGVSAPLALAGVAHGGRAQVARRLVSARGGSPASSTLGIGEAGELPPYLPIGAGEARLFGAMVERLRGASSLYLPLAVGCDHLLEADLESGAPGPCVGNMLAALLEGAPAGADLAALGRYFIDQAAQDDADLAALLGSSRAQPKFSDAGGDGSITRVRQIISRYGALCQAWPALQQAARDLPHDVEAEPASARRSASIATSASTPESRSTAAAMADTAPLPLGSPWQTWIWRLQRLHPADATAVVFRAFRAESPIDADRLEQALRLLAGRHRALCCRLVGAVDAGYPLLEFRPTDELVVRRAPPLTGEQLEEARSAERCRPFDLSTELPLRMTLQPDSGRPGESELWVCVHHVAYDGSSETIFWRELPVIFGNLTAGRPPLAGLEPLRSSFVELVQRQRFALDEPTLKARERYWQRKLDGAPELLLGRAQTRDLASTETRHLRQPLPAELSASLRQIGLEHHVSIAMLSLAAWEALLLRWSGERDQVIALDFAGRSDEAEEDQIGLFTAPVALRTQILGDPTLLDLAAAARAQLGDALAHRVPFERLVGALGEGRRRMAGFRIFFSYLTRSSPPSLGPTPLRDLRPDITAKRTDLRCMMEDRPEGLFIHLSGTTALFDQAELARLADAMQQCLTQLCRQPETTLSQIEWISSVDRAQLARWNATTSDYPRDQPLTTLLRAQAVRIPSAIALEAGDERVTYAELFQRADALAARLKRAGVGHGERVGLYLDRHVTLPEAMLAILEAGGGYVPLDPVFPRDRLAFMAEDAGICAIVTRRALLHELPYRAAPVICVDDPPDEPALLGTSVVAERALGPDSLAYVLYTSGSTGRPKGVEIEHRQLVNFLSSMARCPGIDASDILLAVTSVSFDIAGLEIWLPLFCGARICLAGRAEVADANLLKQALERSQATMLQATPSTWRALLATGWSASPRFKALVGGEALPPDLAEVMGAKCNRAWNMYGPTETTIWSSAWQLPQPPERVRVGQPIANTQLHVLDEGLRQLPIGVSGELFIGGEGVARGYLKRPELTAQRFIGDPFRGGAARLYRTGDLARWLPDGTLELLGRNDDQIKVRGHRIETGEVEAALLRLPGVAQAAIALHRPERGDPRIVAYLVPESGVLMPASARLRADLRQWLAEYMLPYHFVVLAALPLTPNGKVDRRILAQMPLEAGSGVLEVEAAASVSPAETASDAETSPAETALMKHFGQALGRSVGLDSDFFEAGGDSLGALRLMASLSKERGLELTSGEVFLHSTPRRMAARLEQLQDGAVRPRHVLPLRSGPGRTAVFLLHPMGGHLASYARLVHHLGGSTTLFGVQAGDVKQPYQSVNERCAAYTSEVISAWHGPLILCGYSLGGVLAFEMAAQLLQAGRTVSAVMLLDAGVPRPIRRGWSKVWYRARELWRFSWQDRRIWALDQLSRRFSDPQADEKDFGEAEGLIDTAEMRRLVEQALRWQAPQYGGRVRLFRASRHIRGYSNPPGSLHWDRHCSELDVVSLPCNHAEILVEPQVVRIVAEVQALLADAEHAP